MSNDEMHFYNLRGVAAGDVIYELSTLEAQLPTRIALVKKRLFSPKFFFHYLGSRYYNYVPLLHVQCTGVHFLHFISM